ncbi:MAG: NAD-dependent epimerase/dehydratase family protein [Sulfuricaulis sp.]
MLITGATGFIGRRLVTALLNRKTTVYALVRDIVRIDPWRQAAVTARSGDLGKVDSLTDVCMDVHTVFHLASCGEEPEPGGGEDAHWRVTVEGTRHLLEAAARSGVKRFINVSSVKAMGEGGEACLDEASPATPVSSYGRAKLEAEGLVLEACRKHGMHVCNLRLPLVYGCDNRGNIWRMIAAIDRGRFPPLPEIGNKRSMVHVDDVVQALLLAADNPAANGQTYIVTDGREYSTHQIHAAICKALGRLPPRWTIPMGLLRMAGRLGDAIGSIRGRDFVFNSGVLNKLTGSAWYSCRKSETELGYRPRFFLDDGLREMTDEYKRTLEP